MFLSSLERKFHELFNEHKNIFILSDLALEKPNKRFLPPLKTRKNTNIFAFSHILIICFRDCIEYKKSSKNLERHILSNGPHLVSPQEAQKVTKTKNEATVEPYFWSLIDCHPVDTVPVNSISKRHCCSLYNSAHFSIVDQHFGALC